MKAVHDTSRIAAAVRAARRYGTRLRAAHRERMLVWAEQMEQGSARTAPA